MDLNKYVKYGKDRNGRQRYKHRETGAVCINPAESREIPQSVKDQVIYAVLYENLCFRQAGRIFKVSHSSVRRWVYNFTQSFDYKGLIDKSMVTEVEVDEIYVITNKKKVETNMNMSGLQ